LLTRHLSLLPFPYSIWARPFKESARRGVLIKKWMCLSHIIRRQKELHALHRSLGFKTKRRTTVLSPVDTHLTLPGYAKLRSTAMALCPQHGDQTRAYLERKRFYLEVESPLPRVSGNLGVVTELVGSKRDARLPGNWR